MRSHSSSDDVVRPRSTAEKSLFELVSGLRTICERSASMFEPMEREPTHPLEIRVLGAIEITASRGAAEAETVAIGGRIQRRILAALLAARPDVVSIDR